MRFYDIQIQSNTTGNQLVKFDGTPWRWTSFANGLNQPAAQQIELDLVITSFATPTGGSLVRIWGIPLQDISQAADLNNHPIQIYGGMQKGLPLATSAYDDNQTGLLLSGTINQAFGNWIGDVMTLDLIIVPDSGTLTTPKNIVFDWKKGQTLETAITNTLSSAFPDTKSNVSINPDLVLSTDQETAYFNTATQFAQYLKGMTAHLLGGTYPGVDILLTENNFHIFDGSTQDDPTEIRFQDLIGQPTWIGFQQIQFNTVMRADLSIGDYVKFPQTQVTTTAASLSQQRSKSAFQGVFQIDFVRHVGNFRSPDGQSWISTFNVHDTSPSATAP